MPVNSTDIALCHKFIILLKRLNCMRRYRNLISVLLLFSATVLIINNLRPHHHHHHQVCYLTDHCVGKDGDHHHDGTAHDGFDHSHNHPINNECKVNTVFIIPFIQKVNGKLICESQKKELLQYNASAEENNGRSILAVSNHVLLTRKQTGRALKILIRALRAPPVC